MGTRSMNGGQTKPLTDHAREKLATLLDGDRPCQEFNDGVVDRLIREPQPLAVIVDGPNPYPSSRKKNPTINHLRITDAGRAELKTPR